MVRLAAAEVEAGRAAALPGPRRLQEGLAAKLQRLGELVEQQAAHEGGVAALAAGSDVDGGVAIDDPVAERLVDPNRQQRLGVAGAQARLALPVGTVKMG